MPSNISTPASSTFNLAAPGSTMGTPEGKMNNAQADKIQPNMAKEVIMLFLHRCGHLLQRRPVHDLFHLHAWLMSRLVVMLLIP